MPSKGLSAKKELELFRQITHIVSSTIELPDLLRQICRMVTNIVKSDSCLIYLVDLHKSALVLSGTHTPHPVAVGKVHLKIGEGITGWAAEHKKPVALSQKAYSDPRFKCFTILPEDKFESFLSVPILIKGRLLGVINLQNKKPRVFSQADVALVSQIAAQIGGSIDNARLYAEANQKTKLIETLSQVSRVVAGESYLEEILRLIVSITAESLGFNICSLMLLDDKQQELSIVATQSLSEKYRKKPPVKVAKSLSGRAVAGKRPIAVMDVRQEPDFFYPEIARSEGLVSLLSVPMMVKEKCIGVLNCYTNEPHQFSETEVKMLASVAHQAAIAIENTKLMEKALASQEELASRKQIERAKGALMREKNLSEDEAYQQMRRSAMDRRKSLKEIAEAILLSGELG